MIGSVSIGSNETVQRIEAFRDLRRTVEAAVLSQATSVDGRRFRFQAPVDDRGLRLGGYVVIEGPDNPQLGQILGLGLDSADVETGTEMGRIPVRAIRGEGTVLHSGGTPFHDAPVRPATSAEVAASRVAAGGRAQLRVGELSLASGVEGSLDAGGFDRHTFLCGQSGSGKTYSLGVLVEQLLLETQLRLVILDPNGDFARLGEVRPGADAHQGDRWQSLSGDLAIHTATASGEQRLKISLADLEAGAIAALLRLDPIADGEAYGELLSRLAEQQPASLESLDDPLALRIANLGIADLGVWARGEAGSTVAAAVDGDKRCVVVDLGSLGTREEQMLVSEAVLDGLWRKRARREPVLIVIDEAHNVCPAAAEDPLTARATEHVMRIAAEGRKFGLYLLVCTQRPQKVHENVVSQCDNLVLMRLNSAADAALVKARFSFVPDALLDQAATFGLGEALVAGKLSPDPMLIRVGARVSEEGGADVPSDWAAAGR
jgi:DNA helicase HerA-like ATPase